MAEIPTEGKVQYNFVGKSGLKVSNVCLGTLPFGEATVGMPYGYLPLCLPKFGSPGQCDEELSHKILDRYVAWGGNFLDTADVYGRGISETIVGNWLQRQTRENIVVATKCRFDMRQPGNVNCVGLSRRHITASIDASLERLKTDYVDIYQTHCFDPAVTIEETYRTLDDLVRCGKVRYVGVSNVLGWQLQKIVDTQQKLGLNPIISLQQQYSLACRESELEAFQVCKTEGIGVLPWSPLPLEGGLLTGNVRRGEKPTEGRVGWVAEDNSRKMAIAVDYQQLPDKTFDLNEAMEAIGKDRGRSIAQVALRWLLQKDVTTSTIIGARTLEQLDQNMAVNGWALTAEEMKKLDELSEPVWTYPYDFYKMNIDRVNKKASDFFVKSLDY